MQELKKGDRKPEEFTSMPTELNLDAEVAYGPFPQFDRLRRDAGRTTVCV
jgi:hypothetical protein